MKFCLALTLHNDTLDTAIHVSIVLIDTLSHTRASSTLSSASPIPSSFSLYPKTWSIQLEYHQHSATTDTVKHP